MNNDNSLGVAVLDTGIGFTVYDKKMEKDVPYGTFALTLINTDYEKIRNSIGDTLKLYFKKSFNPNDTEQFAITLYNKIHLHISYASKGYLRKEHAHIVTNLLVREILNSIETEHFAINGIDNCIPVIFSNYNIRSCAKDILQRYSDDLASIVRETGTYEINSQLLNMETPVYYLNSTAEYLMLDLKMYLERSDKTVKECERCGRLYLPKRKSDKYCRLPIRGERKTCNVIMHILPNDEFAKVRNTARDKQHKQIRYYRDTRNCDYTFLLNLYNDWSIDCQKKCIEFKSKMDIKGFNNWIEETKFTVETLTEEWEKHNKNKEICVPNIKSEN
ncbi:MAG: hypothetical protein IJA10_04075 [Lachnospiraceae bacterium]|nr:hypothetical protein [Lachnospiraceae bacterium]